MGYNTFRFGSLYMEGVAQNFPQQPLPGGDIPEHDQLAHTIHVGATLPGMAITWVKPEGYNLLVADRVLLSNISWTNLATNRLIAGQETIIRGHRFRCRLLGVGSSNEARIPSGTGGICISGGEKYPPSLCRGGRFEGVRQLVLGLRLLRRSIPKM